LDHVLEDDSDEKDTLKSLPSLPQLAISESVTTPLGELGRSSQNSLISLKGRTDAEMLAMWEDLIIITEDVGEESVFC
jgi:hypothetical protein